MAGPQNRKRQHSNHLSQDDHVKKKTRLSAECPNFSPQFWDSLSRVPLTARALRELDRRNNIQPPPKLEGPRKLHSVNLARFARRGGPDLRHLRGYPEPNAVTSTMPPSNTSKTSRSSRRTRNTDATSNFEKSKKSSASSRGPEFEQHLIDHRIYPEGYEYPEDRSTPEPSNLTQILQDLSVPRASLSPSCFPDSEFRNFKRNNTRVVLEDDVMNDIIPTICGNTDIPHKKNIMFTELEPITNEKATKPKPDFFDGSRLEDVDTRVLKERYMYSSIVPTKHPRVPVVPNFFLEAKRHDGCAAVMKRQACYDGAYGTRAMHGLHNSGRENFVYDNNAYTLSSTYHAGTSTLHLYAHHSTAPTTSGDRPEYHMTQLQAHALTNKRETFVEGVTALRNARDLARRYRDNLIEAANARARQSAALGGQDDHAHVNMTCDDSPVLQAAMVDSQSVTRNADDHLQQDIWDQSCSGLSAPQSQHMKESLRDSSQAFAEPGPIDPSTGFVASSSDFSTDRSTSKRSRPSPSSSSTPLPGS